MVWPNPEEVAVLTVDGFEFRDWESVQVRHSKDQHPYFSVRFTCSEGMPLYKNFAVMQIKPGQWCSVTLGGKLAVSGYVYSRQVVVDARRHHVEIQAGSNVITAAYSSVVSKTGEFKDITAEKFLKSIFTGIGINFRVAGKLPETKFPRISITHGQSVLEAAETVLGQIGHYPMTSSPQGGVIVIAEHREGEDTIYEGDLGNPRYIEGREVIFNPGMATGMYSMAQGEGKDGKWGAPVSHAPFYADPFNISLVGGNVPLIKVLEIPTANPEQFMAGRLTAEKEMQGSDLITVTVTVQGWMRPSGGLWNILQKCRVVSPMLVMDGSLALIPKNIIFTQDNQAGTRTTLELCNENALGIIQGLTSSS